MEGSILSWLDSCFAGPDRTAFLYQAECIIIMAAPNPVISPLGFCTSACVHLGTIVHRSLALSITGYHCNEDLHIFAGEKKQAINVEMLFICNETKNHASNTYDRSNSAAIAFFAKERFAEIDSCVSYEISGQLDPSSGVRFSSLAKLCWLLLSSSPLQNFLCEKWLSCARNELYPAARNAFNQLCQDFTINSVFRKTNYTLQRLKGL